MPAPTGMRCRPTERGSGQGSGHEKSHPKVAFERGQLSLTLFSQQREQQQVLHCLREQQRERQAQQRVRHCQQAQQRVRAQRREQLQEPRVCRKQRAQQRTSLPGAKIFSFQFLWNGFLVDQPRGNFNPPGALSTCNASLRVSPNDSVNPK